MTTTATTGTGTPTTGSSKESTLSEWVGPYVTSMMGRAEALSKEPYEVYRGPLTAGTSNLQNKAFTGIGGLGVPTSVTGAATTAGNIANKLYNTQPYTPTTFTSGFNAPTSYTPGEFTNTFNAPVGYEAVGQSFTAPGVAQSYMNPYLQAALDPTLQNIRRQGDISRNEAQSRLAKAGAFGGSRQAILEGELGRNMIDQMAKTTGEGYLTAYNEAAKQFNTEQQRRIDEAQFASKQGMTSAELAARFGLDAARAAEESRQFASKQDMTGADLAAKYGLEALKASEGAKQFGATYGLDALSKALSAAESQAKLGTIESDITRKNLEQMLAAGAQERAIEQEGITADYNEFLAQRDYPLKQVQFLQSMLQGLPISTVSSVPAGASGLGGAAETIGGLTTLLEALKGLFGED